MHGSPGDFQYITIKDSATIFFFFLILVIPLDLHLVVGYLGPSVNAQGAPQDAPNFPL